MRNGVGAGLKPAPAEIRPQERTGLREIPCKSIGGTGLTKKIPELASAKGGGPSVSNETHQGVPTMKNTSLLKTLLARPVPWKENRLMVLHGISLSPVLISMLSCKGRKKRYSFSRQDFFGSENAAVLGLLENGESA